ncbi:hypothetical protein NC652_031706 [Populus alba x Populus x berolinensis]|nr:hypothetical protein NC652_031706 [Populus alba x Populus x berolinensis]
MSSHQTHSLAFAVYSPSQVEESLAYAASVFKSSQAQDQFRDFSGELALRFWSQGDLRKKDDLEKLFSRINFDAVIHFSGLKAVEDNNLAGTINLYEVMAKHNWKKVYQCVFPKKFPHLPVIFQALLLNCSRKKLELLVLSFSMLGDNLLPFPIQSTAY